MKASIDHIATSHVGSLPRPDGLIAANRALEAGEAFDEQAFQQTLRDAVAEVVRRQHELGIDIPGDGEFGKPMGQRVQLRLVVALFLAAARRAQTPASQACTTWRRGGPDPARSC